MKTFVYLGPTLPIKIAKEIAPEMIFLDPISAGDLVNAINLNPDRILIIDGYYEHRPSVWHKEILLALEQGIEVYGTASMGALRAAELSFFGMKGLGDIYYQYKNNILIDDDEVSIIHAQKAQGYTPISDAMVNIRATLANARNHQIITSSEEVILLDTAKLLFYPDRTIKMICQKASKTIGMKATILSQWIRHGNYVDKKANDAIRALRFLKQKQQQKCIKELKINQDKPLFNLPLTKNIQSGNMSLKAQRTIFLLGLIKKNKITCHFQKKLQNEFQNKQKNELEGERKNKNGFNNHFEYKIVSELALLNSIIYQIIQPETLKKYRSTYNPPIDNLFSCYLENEYLNQIYQWINNQYNKKIITSSNIDSAINHLKTIYCLPSDEDLNEKLLKNNLSHRLLDPLLNLALKQHAALLLSIICHLKTEGFSLTTNALALSKKSLYKNYTKTKKTPNKYSCSESKLLEPISSVKPPINIIEFYTYFNMIVKSSNIFFLIPHTSQKNINWLQIIHSSLQPRNHKYSNL